MIAYEESVRFLYSPGQRAKSRQVRSGADPRAPRRPRQSSPAWLLRPCRRYQRQRFHVRHDRIRLGAPPASIPAFTPRRILPNPPNASGSPASRSRGNNSPPSSTPGIRCAESLIARGEIDQHPSYFETVTAMAFVAQSDVCDWIVLEALAWAAVSDATNVVEPKTWRHHAC